MSIDEVGLRCRNSFNDKNLSQNQSHAVLFDIPVGDEGLKKICLILIYSKKKKIVEILFYLCVVAHIQM